MEERRLTAMHPPCNAIYDEGTTSWLNLNGWQEASPGLGFPNTLYHETSIDLSGYARESLTFFPEAIGLQDPGVYLFRATPGAPATALQVLDIVTSVPMDIIQVANAQAGVQSGPGMIGSDYDFQSIIFGMYRFFSLNTNIPYQDYQQLERSQRFDSGEPNAADRLYCYRIVTTTGSLAPDSLISIPAARQLIGGAVDAEPELVYMQRLKRSYELAQQV